MLYGATNEEIGGFLAELRNTDSDELSIEELEEIAGGCKYPLQRLHCKMGIQSSERQVVCQDQS